MLCETIRLWPERPDVTLTGYIHSHSPMLPPGDKRPAVIVCPGGAYLMCADTEAEPVALQFAAMGYHAFVLRYSVYGAATGNPGGRMKRDALPCEKTLYPAASLDLGKAILMLRERAEQWHLDPERIAVCGFSAGAHCCAMYLTDYASPAVAGALEAAPERLRPAAAVLGYGFYDARMLGLPTGDPVTEGMNAAMCMTLLGERKPAPERLEAISPLLRVHGDMPPCFLWATGEDQVVPPRNTLDFAAALLEKGVPAEAHLFETGPHGMATAAQVSAAGRSSLNADAAKWVSLAEAWLLKRFALEID